MQTSAKIANHASRLFLPIISAISPTIRIMQWNILADGVSGLHPTLGDFPFVTGEDMIWENRKNLILKDIAIYAPDILLMQEVDHFWDFFTPQLSALGYSGLFCKKPDSPCLQFSSLEDGCSTFYKSDRLHLLSHQSFTYSDQEEDGERGHFNQVCQMSLFDDTSTHKRFLVVNTHLKATKSAAGELIRLKQARQMLKTIQATISHLEGQTEVIIAGDFNANDKQFSDVEPLVYPFITSQPDLHLTSCYHSCHESHASSLPWSTWKFRKVKLMRGISEVINFFTGGEESCNNEVKRCIDYVLISDGFGISSILELPDEADVGANRLPNSSYPSDHVSLVVDLF